MGLATDYGTNGENRLARVARRVKPQLRVGDADDEGAAAGLLDGAQARECRGDRRRLGVARASEGVRASEGSEGVRVVAVRVRVRVRSRARARNPSSWEAREGGIIHKYTHE